jgi:long-chain fatty acid transport protein
MKRSIIGTIIVASVASAGGYKIPEQSLNGMALGAAYVAHTTGADTAYYNPAGMAFMENKSFLDMGMTLAHLPKIEYNLVEPYSGESKEENILIPYSHYVAPAMGDFRWGMSIVAPGGLTKRWDTAYQKLYAEEFTLKIVELNPSLSYRVNDHFAIAGGLRLIYSEGIVKSDGGDIFDIRRDMEGDALEFGYNLALLYKAQNDINIGVTYRSNVDITEEGPANLYLGEVGEQYDAKVTIPLPAALNVALSKTWNNSFTLEFNYERTYWSTYKALDFEYSEALANPVLVSAFDDPKTRAWRDTNTFRIGATIEMENDITFMLGFSIDETPVNNRYIGFELPDSDAKIFSMGVRYQQTENLSWGIAFLYDSKDINTLQAGEYEDESSVLNYGGSFEGGGAYLTTIGLSYEY